MMASSNGFTRSSYDSTIVDVLRDLASRQPDKLAYRFLANEKGEEVTLTYQELDQQARAIAALLQSLGAPGERALLLFPPDLGYITAFLGCLYAGVTVIPSYPPRPNRRSTRIEAILADARPAFVLTTASIRAHTERWLPQLPDRLSLHWLVTDDLPDDLAPNWRDPGVGCSDLAFLQYTSGSTAVPRGVMLTHGNLMHNLAQIQHAFQASPDSRSVIWLPLYHDMGLIGGVLETLYCGGSSTLLSPVAFLQHPFRWLQTISQSRADVSGGPNFAYELCTRKITPEQRAELDLSSWKIAFNGAEPIRADTLERFAETFASCGFRREVIYPCYGLAEATLMVSGNRVGEPPVFQVFDPAALEKNDVVVSPVDSGGRMLVSSGRPLPGHKVSIVDPETNTACAPNRVGEIWVASPSVAQGYWNRSVDSERTFGAQRMDTSEGPFLRTGDLGFLHDGELFVTGRLKDLIIIRGRNYYPQDIEWTVQQCHPALRADACAVFAVEVDGEERLVVVQELERAHRSANVEEVITAIRQVVSGQHELNIHAVRLLKPMSIPKTSSGKIQRHACREAFQAGTLDEIGAWTQEALQTPALEVTSGEYLARLRETPVSDRRNLLLSFLQEVAGDALGLSRTEPIDPAQPLRDLGFDSVIAVNVCNSVGTGLGRTLPATLLFDFPTLEELADHLIHELFPTTLATPEQNPDLAAMIEQIEGLSEEELDAILCEQNGYHSKTEEVG